MLAKGNIPLIKICGVKNPTELEIVEKYADATGVIVQSKSKRCIDLKTAREIISNAVIPVFAVSVSNSLDEWLQIISKTECDLVQVHAEIDAETCDRIKEHAKMMKAFIVENEGRGQEAVERQVARILGDIERLNPHFILLDSGCGSGRTHNWEVSRRIAERFSIFLAGGLNPENVAKAVREVEPAGVDVSSGVEVNGFKDEYLLRELVRRARNEIW